MEQALPANVEKLLSDLQSQNLMQRIQAVEELGKVKVSHERIIMSLEKITTSDTNMFDGSIQVKEAAKKSLQAPVHQTFLKQLRQQPLAQIGTVDEPTNSMMWELPTKLEPGIESMREKMIKNTTYYLAAAFIANSGFPKKGDIPRLTPPLFNNFGHQLLLDYELLVKIIWQVITDIQSNVKNTSTQNWGIILGIITALVTIVIIPRAGVAPPLLIGFITFLIGNAFYQSKQKLLKKEVGNIRAQAIEKLISGSWNLEKVVQGMDNGKLHLVGDGTIDGDKVPILIVFNDKHPFPGYGQLQAENLFVCRPKNNNTESVFTSTTIKEKQTEIRKEISEKIMDTVSKYETKHVSFGNIVAIHGNSLFIDSPWLDRDKVPFLWMDKDKLDHAESIDKRASVRTYFVTQVLFPQFLTAATFFVRPFIAGNSASCQIAVTTMGPQRFSLDYFSKRLLRHQMEVDGTIKKVDQKPQKKTNSKETVSFVSEELRLVRSIAQAGNEFQSYVDVKAIEKLNAREDEPEDYSKEFKEAIKENVMWPGYLVALNTVREANSLTFTNDFFGKTEAIASVKTLYDQISRALLDTLDTLDFDISDYRDKEGNYSINAEKIDQLILGERIQLGQAKESEKTGVPQPTSE